MNASIPNRDNKDILAMFVRLLKKKKCLPQYKFYLEEYIKSLEKMLTGYPNVMKRGIFATEDPKDYITGAFNWCKTKEGANFWLCLHYEWISILDLFKP